LSAIIAQHSTDLGLEVRLIVMRDVRPDDELTTWIADLRARLDRGDLATLGPVDVGHGTDILPAQDTVRIMLAELEDFADMTPDEANEPVNAARRDVLLTSFRILRTLIG
jgi:hypothetical protein